MDLRSLARASASWRSSSLSVKIKFGKLYGPNSTKLAAMASSAASRCWRCSCHKTSAVVLVAYIGFAPPSSADLRGISLPSLWRHRTAARLLTSTSSKKVQAAAGLFRKVVFAHFKEGLGQKLKPCGQGSQGPAASARSAGAWQHWDEGVELQEGSVSEACIAPKLHGPHKAPSCFALGRETTAWCSAAAAGPMRKAFVRDGFPCTKTRAFAKPSALK